MGHTCLDRVPLSLIYRTDGPLVNRSANHLALKSDPRFCNGFEGQLIGRHYDDHTDAKIEGLIIRLGNIDFLPFEPSAE